MKEGTSPEVLKARESRGEPRVGRVRGSGPCRGVIERPGGSRHDTAQVLDAITGKSTWVLDALAKEKESDSTSKRAFDQAAKFHKNIVKDLTLHTFQFEIFNYCVNRHD